MLSFMKVQCCANDFILVETDLRNAAADTARSLCSRRTGIGADGLLILSRFKSGRPKFTVYNADGSKAEICGNGLLCAGLYLKLRYGFTDTTMETDADICRVRSEKNGEITAALPLPKVREQFSIDVKGECCPVLSMDVGNPHAVVFGSEPILKEAEQTAARIAALPAFRSGVNVEICSPAGVNRFAARVIERGCGETGACGSGAAACASAALRLGLLQAGAAAEIQMPGGTLRVRPEGRHSFLTGNPRRVFEGLVADSDFG